MAETVAAEVTIGGAYQVATYVPACLTRLVEAGIPPEHARHGGLFDHGQPQFGGSELAREALDAPFGGAADSLALPALDDREQPDEDDAGFGDSR